ncbi:MAG: hypothetical protein U0667_09515 [Chloroflexota bacterium]
MADSASDADARTVWCDVMVPSGLVEGRMRVTLATVGEEYLWYMPDCDDPDSVPDHQPY